MKCEVCDSLAQKNSVVCSENCKELRLQILRMISRCCPSNGCENCWSDLHQGCSEQCKQESRKTSAFSRDLWTLIRCSQIKESK